MPRLVAAPDKLRGTATANEAADAIVGAARAAGWTATAHPMSDGGEGFLDALGGEVRTATVAGPLGGSVEARYALLEDGTAVVEAAEACGRALVPAPTGDDPVLASTYGVGELVAAALAGGPTALVVGCGGTATTDGGEGCLRALEDRAVALDVPVTVACDVTVRFVDAARRFGPQKGATAPQVRALEARLTALAHAYRDRYGVDVAAVPGAGAAGGLAGGLVALGARVAEGAALVASATGLHAALEAADLLVTAEGRVDEGTLAGKVVAVVLGLAPRLPALVVAGEADPRTVAELAASRPGTTTVATLAGRREPTTAAAIVAVVAAHLASLA